MQKFKLNKYVSLVADCILFRSRNINTYSQKENLICTFLNSTCLEFVNYCKDGTLPDEEFFESKFQKRENF